MAFLPGRNLTYLFGGSSGSIETWAWDGRYWTQVARIGPDGRTAHTTTFDTSRGHIVLFGGQPSPGKALQDTWAFGGEEWTQLEDLGPTPRHDHATAYDVNRSRLVLFGGLQSSNGTEGVVGDTWEWDGTSWTQTEETGPAPRCGHAMAYDSLRQRTLLFGGLVDTGSSGALQPVGDTWEWDGTNWTQVADTGPTARYGAAMTSSGGTLILHGGKSDLSLGDTWQWTDGSWSKLQDIGPPRRHAHAITFDTARQRIVVFGGEREPDNPQSQEPEFFADTWEAHEKPIAKNLSLNPTSFDVIGGAPNTFVTVDFEIDIQNVTIQYSLFLTAGNTVHLLFPSQIPAGTTRQSETLGHSLLNQVVNQLNLQLPADVTISTNLGDASARLTLTGGG
jgi:hypothetical protein